MTRPTNAGGIKTTGTVFDILETLTTREKMTVTEITEEVDVSKGTVHAHLQTLKERGYLVQTDDKAYRLGLRFLSLGGHVQNTTYKHLYRNAKPELDELAEDTGERVQVIVEEAGYGVFLYQAVGGKAVITDSHIGSRIALHATAAGKAYLSHLPTEEAEKLVDASDLSGYTDTTITDRETLFETLEEIRERGAAYDSGERVSGIRCIGVPIQSDDGETLGSISISVPKQRMNQAHFQSETEEQLRNIARMIGLNTTYS